MSSPKSMRSLNPACPLKTTPTGVPVPARWINASGFAVSVLRPGMKLGCPGKGSDCCPQFTVGRSSAVFAAHLTPNRVQVTRLGDGSRPGARGTAVGLRSSAAAVMGGVGPGRCRFRARQSGAIGSRHTRRRQDPAQAAPARTRSRCRADRIAGRRTCRSRMWALNCGDGRSRRCGQPRCEHREQGKHDGKEPITRHRRRRSGTAAARAEVRAKRMPRGGRWSVPRLLAGGARRQSIP